MNCEVCDRTIRRNGIVVRTGVHVLCRLCQVCMVDVKIVQAEINAAKRAAGFIGPARRGRSQWCTIPEAATVWKEIRP